MTLVVTHTKVSGKSAGNDSTRVYGTHWDANHTLVGTVDASQLNANVVQSVVSDTNVTGSISGQVMTLGWTGFAGLARGGTNADLSATGGTHQVLKQSTVGAAVTVGQLAFSDISGSVAASQLPNPTASTLGGIESYAAVTHQWINTISTSGVPSSTQPAFTDISGSVAATQMPALTGDVTTSAGAVATTIAANAVTNAKMATMAAWTFKANNTSGSATPTDITIDGLTLKGSPASTDEVIIWDVAGSALKKATVSGIGASSGVSSIAGNTGAFTLANGIDNSTNQIQLTAARRTLPTTQSLTSGSSATYTTPANCLWIEVFMVGGGGGGAGVGTASSGSTVAGADGTKSTFNSIDAAPGKGGGVSGTTTPNFYVGGLGGSAGSGSATRRYTGQQGGSTFNPSALGATASGEGGATTFGGAGGGGQATLTTATGIAGAANTGGGGGGAASGSGTNFVNGAGGGGGESVYLLINSPSGTYTYTIGGGGAGGVGTSVTGGAGGTGYIFVVEHYGT